VLGIAVDILPGQHCCKMGQHPGYYNKQIVKLQKELQSKQSQLQVQLDINDGLRWVSADVCS
jgi:hypothetical protein